MAQMAPEHHVGHKGLVHLIPVLFLASVMSVLLLASACSKPPVEPIKLDGGIVTIDNRTKQEWANVEIWINTYYRITARSIPAGARFQAPLGTAVAGFGQRFDFRRMQVKDVRLSAKLPDGRPLEIKKEFAAGGLAGALGGKR